MLKLCFALSLFSALAWSKCSEVYLSLDFGGRVGDGPEIVEYLVEKRVPHLIFMVGKNLKTAAAKELCSRIKNDPEYKKYVRLGNHSFSHKGFSKEDTRAYLKKEIMGNEAKIKEACGGANFVKVFRYPKGQTHPEAEKILKANGYTSEYSKYSSGGEADDFSVGWTADTKDWLEEGGASVWAQKEFFERKGKFMPVTENSRRALREYASSSRAPAALRKAAGSGRGPELYNPRRHRAIEGWHGPDKKRVVEKILNDDGVDGKCVPLTHFGGHHTLEALKTVVPALRLRAAKFKHFEDGEGRVMRFFSQFVGNPASDIEKKACSSCFEDGKYHEVKKGDTLFSVSRKYGLPVSKVKEYNNLSNNEIVIGQRLLLMPSAEVYHVRPGDTLFAISRRFGVSVAKLRKDNELDSNEIVIDQKLYIEP